jgi:hypothetical protein
MRAYTLERIFVCAAIGLSLVLALVLPAAAQQLTADPYPAAGAPDACRLAVSDGPVSVPEIACTLPAVSGGVRPTCPLVSLTTFGKYTLVLTCTRAGGVANGTDSGSYTTPGSASSRPFAYSYAVAPVAAPVVRLAP